MTILIVDDSDKMRRLIKTLIADIAQEMYECSDGAEALTAYAEHRPTWVLMDAVMKQVDGLTATRQIRTVFPDAKIIMVTNYDDEYLREAAERAGACGYVVKDNLLAVRRILSGRE